MSQPYAEPSAVFGAPDPPGTRRTEPVSGRRLPLAVQYLIVLMMVAVATLLAFVFEHLISTPNLTLIYVLPVVLAATAFGWGPALAATVAGVLAFDFFFTRPYFSLWIAAPSDLWAATLLLAIAAIVSSVAADARRQAVETRRAMEQSQALQGLAHAVIEGRPQADILSAAATALTRIFRAPVVIFMECGGEFAPVATAGGAKLTTADEDAARGALETRMRLHAGAYPYDDSKFDLWPVITRDGRGSVLGVDFSRTDERPTAPDRLVEIVGAYLTTALSAR